MTRLRVGPLVRAIGPYHVAIWTEWTQPTEVILRAKPAGHSQDQEQEIPFVRSRTITVGRHHYAISRLTGLHAATWYTYEITTMMQDMQQIPPPALQSGNSIVQCFRTFDPPEAPTTLRLAYGSCRKLSVPGPDALSAFGSWLSRSLHERETTWPHLLLLIGDQIYADDYTGRRKRTRPLPSNAGQEKSERAGAQSFAEFADLYETTWTCDAGIRQVLAALPVYMIFDDHEITNSWNIWPGWRSLALQHGHEQMLVDGLVAYWLYQGWGNICMQDSNSHPLLAIMHKAEQSGEDVLEDLRACIRRAIYQEIHLRWHYAIQTNPPIFVADVRADRPASLGAADDHSDPPRIMSQEQMKELQTWMQQHDAGPILLVSSVPLLLTPFIGFAEYLMGIRPLHNVHSAPIRSLARYLARIQQKVALRMSFDHWPVFAATWREFVKLLRTRKHDIIVLSGDVHFSYSVAAHSGFSRFRKNATFYQLVASPFSNTLESRDKRLVAGQAWIKRMIYGGLHIRMLPLCYPNTTKRLPHDLLFQNTVALVTIQPPQERRDESGLSAPSFGEEVGARFIAPGAANRLCFQQIYLGVKDGILQAVATNGAEK
ncbi:MAG TPA: alkaline phosphatase D family protein [Ktedonobacteraceae bacterium]|nr:alkaline phosphatase D family protein [Ktedonobacteraceae bacterium]